MFWLQIAAEGGFCCYNNSCNGSQALCAAEMLAFEDNGKGNVGSQWCLWDIIRGTMYGGSNNLVQELRLDDAWFAAYFRLDRVLCSYHTTPKLVR